MAAPRHTLTDLVSTESLVAWVRAFVREPSQQTALFEADPCVQRFLGETVCGVLADLGIGWRRDAMGNVIAECGEGRPRAMLMAYAMTHPANRMTDPFGANLIETEAGPGIRGRGVAEQMSALAAAIAAFQGVRKSGIPGRVILAISAAGETGTHHAAETICGTLDELPDFGVLAIGTSGRVSLANKGRIDVEITIRGRSAHSSTPWAGIDALRGARRVLDLLDHIDLSEPKHPRLGAATLAATAIESFPKATHTIQDEVRLTVDRRLLPGQSPDAAFREIAAVLECEDLAPWSICAEVSRIQLPAEIDSDCDLARTIARGQKDFALPIPKFFDSHGCVDAGYLQSLGVASTMWGPGDQSLWHAEDEYVLIPDLITGAESYFAFLTTALTQD
jgi:acetylornithine deacetylase/succinyl-diaminopimelate desuccinylase-like protein